MSTWTAPATFSSGAVLTAAQLNATRDNLNFLKGALDTLTGATTADTGSTMNIRLLRTASTDPAMATAIPADTFFRWATDAAGKMTWGSGSGAADTTLYRLSANILATDDSLYLVGAAGRIIMDERTDPGAAAANTAEMYVKDNGAGKTQLVVVFSSGAVQVLATQP